MVRRVFHMQNKGNCEALGRSLDKLCMRKYFLLICRAIMNKQKIMRLFTKFSSLCGEKRIVLVSVCMDQKPCQHMQLFMAGQEK